MLTSVITEQPELLQFLEGAEERFGDPSRSTCLVFVRYQEETREPIDVPALLALWDPAHGAMRIHVVDEKGAKRVVWAVPVTGGEDPELEGGVLAAFGMRKVARGLWALNPSLNLPGEFHGYVVVHGVPDPAPWEWLVLLASEVPGGMAFGGGR